jgi:S1-C subfamily serine protease
VLEVDGQALEGVHDLVQVLGERAPGDELELLVLHGDDERALTAMLGERNGRAYLGIVPCGGMAISLERDVELSGASALIIVEVIEDSPAEAAGLQEGDVLLTVDGREIGADADLAEVIAGYEPGDEIALQVERPSGLTQSGEGPIELTVTLGENPDEDGAPYLGVRYRRLPHAGMLGRLPRGGFRGIDPEDLPFELPFDLPEGRMPQGALVREVAEGSPAAEAGLARGDVITAIDSDPVDSPMALSDAIAEREPGDTVDLTFIRPDEEGETVLEVVLGEHPDREGKAYLGVTAAGVFRMWRFGGEDGSSAPGQRFELPFGLELPFGRRFEFRWPPTGVRCPGGAGRPASSI